jgi:uncharacterized protein (TIGR02611 family)
MATTDAAKRLRGRAASVRARVRALPGGRLVWRVAVTIVGVAVVAGGIILLPLPGPGWLIIFAGLGILATEYEWAARLLRFARDQLKRWTRWVAEQPRWVHVLGGVATTLVIAAIVVAAWFVYF